MTNIEDQEWEERLGDPDLDDAFALRVPTRRYFQRLANGDTIYTNRFTSIQGARDLMVVVFRRVLYGFHLDAPHAAQAAPLPIAQALEMDRSIMPLVLTRDNVIESGVTFRAFGTQRGRLRVFEPAPVVQNWRGHEGALIGGIEFRSIRDSQDEGNGDYNRAAMLRFLVMALRTQFNTTRGFLTRIHRHRMRQFQLVARTRVTFPRSAGGGTIEIRPIASAYKTGYTAAIASFGAALEERQNEAQYVGCVFRLTEFYINRLEPRAGLGHGGAAMFHAATVFRSNEHAARTWVTALDADTAPRSILCLWRSLAQAHAVHARKSALLLVNARQAHRAALGLRRKLGEQDKGGGDFESIRAFVAHYGVVVRVRNTNFTVVRVFRPAEYNQKSAVLDVMLCHFHYVPLIRRHDVRRCLDSESLRVLERLDDHRVTRETLLEAFGQLVTAFDPTDAEQRIDAAPGNTGLPHVIGPRGVSEKERERIESVVETIAQLQRGESVPIPFPFDRKSPSSKQVEADRDLRARKKMFLMELWEKSFQNASSGLRGRMMRMFCLSPVRLLEVMEPDDPRRSKLGLLAWDIETHPIIPSRTETQPGEEVFEDDPDQAEKAAHFELAKTYLAGYAWYGFFFQPDEFEAPNRDRHLGAAEEDADFFENFDFRMRLWANDLFDEAQAHLNAAIEGKIRSGIEWYRRLLYGASNDITPTRRFLAYRGSDALLEMMESFALDAVYWQGMTCIAHYGGRFDLPTAMREVFFNPSAVFNRINGTPITETPFNVEAHRVIESSMRFINFSIEMWRVDDARDASGRLFKPGSEWSRQPDVQLMNDLLCSLPDDNSFGWKTAPMRLQFHDSFALFPSSLRALAREAQCDVQKGDVEHDQITAENWSAEPRFSEEIAPYHRADCEALLEVIIQNYGAVAELTGLPASSLISSAQSSKSGYFLGQMPGSYGQFQGGDPRYQMWTLAFSTDEFLRRAYKGGMVGAFQIREIDYTTEVPRRLDELRRKQQEWGDEEFRRVYPFFESTAFESAAADNPPHGTVGDFASSYPRQCGRPLSCGKPEWTRNPADVFDLTAGGTRTPSRVALLLERDDWDARELPLCDAFLKEDGFEREIMSQRPIAAGGTFGKTGRTAVVRLWVRTDMRVVRGDRAYWSEQVVWPFLCKVHEGKLVAAWFQNWHEMYLTGPELRAVFENKLPYRYAFRRPLGTADRRVVDYLDTNRTLARQLGNVPAGEVFTDDVLNEPTMLTEEHPDVVRGTTGEGAYHRTAKCWLYPSDTFLAVVMEAAPVVQETMEHLYEVKRTAKAEKRAARALSAKLAANSFYGALAPRRVVRGLTMMNLLASSVFGARVETENESLLDYLVRVLCRPRTLEEEEEDDDNDTLEARTAAEDDRMAEGDEVVDDVDEEFVFEAGARAWNAHRLEVVQHTLNPAGAVRAMNGSDARGAHVLELIARLVSSGSLHGIALHYDSSRRPYLMIVSEHVLPVMKHNVAAAADVTAYARRMLWEAMTDLRRCGMPVMYGDTDSFHVMGMLDRNEYFRKKWMTDPVTGEWDERGLSCGNVAIENRVAHEVVHGNKFYAIRDIGTGKEKLTAKGVRLRNLMRGEDAITFANLQQLFEPDGVTYGTRPALTQRQRQTSVSMGSFVTESAHAMAVVSRRIVKLIRPPAYTKGRRDPATGRIDPLIL